MLSNSRTLFYISGPIGVGKTTLLFTLAKSWPLDSAIELVSTDLYYYMFFRENCLPIEIGYERAKLFCSYKISRIISMEKSFIWETVFAKQDKLDVLYQCREAGYKIIGLFLGTSKHDILIDRSNNRLFDGWYSVPQNKIMNRHKESLRHLKTINDMSDSLFAMDCSGTSPRLVYAKINGCVTIDDQSCDWISQAF